MFLSEDEYFENIAKAHKAITEGEWLVAGACFMGASSNADTMFAYNADTYADKALWLKRKHSARAESKYCFAKVR